MIPAKTTMDSALRSEIDKAAITSLFYGSQGCALSQVGLKIHEAALPERQATSSTAYLASHAAPEC